MPLIIFRALIVFCPDLQINNIHICELYAIDHNIMISAKKSVITFRFLSFKRSMHCKFTMLNGQSIQYVKIYIHLGNELCPLKNHVLIDNAVKDLNCRPNNLLADFAQYSSSTLLDLFRTYCTNIIWIATHRNGP